MSHKIQAILERVRQYQLPRWQYQSLHILNPYRLASMGYVPLDRETLQCSICLKEVKIGEERQEQVEQLQNQLKQHDENCIYLNEEGTKIDREELYLCMEEISTELNERSTAERYPILKSSSIWKYTERDRFMLKKVMKLYQIEAEQMNISFFLRLFGWFFQKNEENQDCLACYFCGRSVALQHFKTTENVIQNSQNEQQADQEQLFDPIEEHRYFCMWTGQQQNWLVLLQDLQDKFSEYLSFKLRVQPLSTKKMKIHIDKYLESFNQKVEGSVIKLKQVGEEFSKLCEYLAEDKNAEISSQGMENDKKRIRSVEQDINLASQTVKMNMNPSKKVKTI